MTTSRHDVSRVPAGTITQILTIGSRLHLYIYICMYLFLMYLLMSMFVNIIINER